MCTQTANTHITYSCNTRRDPWTATLSLRIQRWVHRHRSRKALAQLSDHTLRDLGLTRGQSLTEARKPFWK
ncbi:DUF1127 domain-containing protein [Reinekea blandensis]|uniref:YjiS-like domain-containing protein n=1 Tax=Reinekea blandensis MED297 TaxID=314283 RepID=A4BCT5_9GAMM|nr:DUF1127 domain-containing protein [Reinekea blandensis]EAR10017.1 hypothetical protein MED297_08011 [Reinekea sp. MED297] [Reinekea blandensis MED297]